MKIFAISASAFFVALGSLGLGAYIPYPEVMEDCMGIDGHDTYIGPHSQPKYTVFLKEDRLGGQVSGQQGQNGVVKRGYYTCYNRQVLLHLSLPSVAPK
jgi:hypothetical protein